MNCSDEFMVEAPISVNAAVNPPLVWAYPTTSRGLMKAMYPEAKA